MTKNILLNNKWVWLVGGLLFLVFLGVLTPFIVRYYGSFPPRPTPPATISHFTLPVSPILPPSPLISTAQNEIATVSLTESVAISKPPTSTAIPVITQTTWLTLTDTEADYSLSYPANFHWQVLKRKDGLSNINSLSFDLPDVHARHTMHIQVEPNPNKFSVRIFLKKLYEQNNMLDESSALIQTTIKSLIVYQTANFPEKIAEQTANRTEIPDFHILVPYKDKVYRFTLLHDAAISESTPAATAIFFKIIATFHNTDSTPMKPAERWALPQVDPFDDWITFIDKEAGYSLRYPANFFISQGGQSKEQPYRDLDISFGNRQGMGIYIAPNPQKLSIKRFVDEAAASNKYNSPEIPMATMLEGVEIMGMPIYETNLFFGNVQILLPYQDKVYIFSLGYMIGGVPSTPEEKAIFFKIIDTFRLIDAE